MMPPAEFDGSMVVPLHVGFALTVDEFIALAGVFSFGDLKP